MGVSKVRTALNSHGGNPKSYRLVRERQDPLATPCRGVKGHELALLRQNTDASARIVRCTRNTRLTLPDSAPFVASSCCNAAFKRGRVTVNSNSSVRRRLLPPSERRAHSQRARRRKRARGVPTLGFLRVVGRRGAVMAGWHRAELLHWRWAWSPTRAFRRHTFCLRGAAAPMGARGR